MVNVIRAVNRWTHRIFLLIGEIALAAMIVVVTMTVILRYFFNTGIGWAEEVPRLLVTLFTFLACAMGVRDKTHMCVGIVYNRFRKDGFGRKFLEVFGDVCVLLCGLFMLYYGGMRCIRMMGLAGTLPMTGLKTWWQFVPIPLAGFLITFDSILYLTGVLKPGDTLFSEPDKDAAELYCDSLTEEAAVADGTVLDEEIAKAACTQPSGEAKKEGDAQ
ncbi:MAG: TRAP transporter small permease [Candidatus Limiplasma sp.]|nr:TRAP transporter small permease [Candidatus Limiplasma sp.]MEA5146337.1 TRAP transporter small permease [Candidatus Limiplasma sp.]